MSKDDEPQYSGSISDRIEQVFIRDTNRDYAADYLSAIDASRRDVYNSVGKSMFLIIVLIGAFELIIRAAIAKVSIGPFEVKDLSFIRTALPVIVAYLFYQVGYLGALGADLDVAHEKLFEMLHKDVLDSELDVLIGPVQSSLMGPSLPARKGTIYGIIAWTIALIVLSAGAVFQVYAYYIQFRDLHANNLLVWISLILTVIFIVYGIIVFLSQAS